MVKKKGEKSDRDEEGAKERKEREGASANFLRLTENGARPRGKDRAAQSSIEDNETYTLEKKKHIPILREILLSVT